MAGHRSDDPLTHRGPAAGPSHRGGGCGLVDVDQPLRVQATHFRAEIRPFLLDVGAVLLLGLGDFLLERELELGQGPADGHGAAGDAQALPQFLKGGIGLLADQLAEPLEILGPQGGGVSSPMGLGLERAGGAVSLQEPDDEGEADQESPSDPA